MLRKLDRFSQIKIGLWIINPVIMSLSIVCFGRIKMRRNGRDCAGLENAGQGPELFEKK